MMVKNTMRAGLLLVLFIAAFIFVPAVSAEMLGGDKGWVNFHTNIDGASIYVDGEFKGTTTNGVLTVDFYSTASPSHSAYAVMSGYQQTQSKYFTTPAAGQTENCYFTLNPLPATGTVYVTSVPSGASVYLEGAYVGTTPYSCSMDAGKHLINIRRSGYEDWSSSFLIYKDQETRVSASLTPTQKYGTIRISSTPSGADVYVDGVYKGVTPLTIKNAADGYYSVKIEKEGYYMWSGAAKVIGEGTADVSAVLSAQESLTGTVYVSTTPGGASIYVDGELMGTSPLTGLLTLDGIAPGVHNVRASLAGYSDNSVSAAVPAGSSATVSIPLSTVYGQIQAVSSPAGANVYVDNVYKGVTPVTFTASAGEHKVDFVMNGYAGTSVTTIVSDGQTMPVSVTLTPVSGHGQQSPAPIAALFAALGAAAVLAGRRE